MFRRGANGSMSPSKRGLNNTLNHQSTTSGGNSPAKKGHLKSPSGKKNEEEEKGLTSPTSISMYNSFIIKNADESFDQYYHQMRKRKQ
ncbi:MAG: hypothetical protein ACMG6E_10090 [Candidatus Roizmanbacteria bacterium]